MSLLRQESRSGLIVWRRKPFHMPERIKTTQPILRAIVVTFPAAACVWFSYSSGFTRAGSSWSAEYQQRPQQHSPPSESRPWSRVSFRDRYCAPSDDEQVDGKRKK